MSYNFQSPPLPFTLLIAVNDFTRLINVMDPRHQPQSLIRKQQKKCWRPVINHTLFYYHAFLASRELWWSKEDRNNITWQRALNENRIQWYKGDFINLSEEEEILRWFNGLLKESHLYSPFSSPGRHLRRKTSFGLPHRSWFTWITLVIFL